MSEGKGMEANPPHVIACAKVAGELRPIPQGVTRAPCTDCGQQVFVSPTSLNLMAQGLDFRVVCTECHEKYLSHPGVITAPVPGASRECAEWNAWKERN